MGGPKRFLGRFETSLAAELRCWLHRLSGFSCTPGNIAVLSDKSGGVSSLAGGTSIDISAHVDRDAVVFVSAVDSVPRRTATAAGQAGCVPGIRQPTFLSSNGSYLGRAYCRISCPGRTGARAAVLDAGSNSDNSVPRHPK